MEHGDTEATSRRWKRIAVKSAIIATVVIAAMAVFPRGRVYQVTVGVDDIWKEENLQAPFQFAIRKTDDTIEQERERIRKNTPPIFFERLDISSVVASRADSIEVLFDSMFDKYGLFQNSILRGRLGEAAGDSIAYRSARDSLSFRFPEDTWQVLLQSYTNSVPGLISDSRSRITSERLDRTLMEVARRQSNTLLARGVLDVNKSFVSTRSITKRSDVTSRQVDLALSEVLGIDEAHLAGRIAIESLWSRDQVEYRVAQAFLQELLLPNLIYNSAASQELWAELESQIVPSDGIVRENEVIVRQGDIITADIHRKLISFETEMTERSGKLIKWKTLTGQLILTLSTFLIFFLFLYLLRRPIFDDNKMVLLIVLLFLGVIALYGIALRAALLDMYVVPVAMVAVLLTVIFDSRVALLGALTMALMGSHLLNYNFAFTFATMFASTLGIFSVRDVRNRGQFFISASIVFMGYMLVLSANLLLQNKPVDRFIDETIFVAINSVLLLLAYPALWIFERAFDVTTDLTLLELSDMNRPVLKELSLKAPGTFNHVLQVANLAESAAAAIGANALLTRVGALYHDIGKMVKPEYFVENQRGGVNPHDGLKPRMCALIIASHVKDGLDLAKKYRLPKEVQDFIPMHHGTARIEYFYQKAISLRKKGDSEVMESEFRYPGPKPTTKETSILMLADSIEAASRSLENPTHKRLESLIESIVDSRREDGQLDNTNLTFSELNTIKESLLNVLMGIYHVRIKYPGEEESFESADLDISGNKAAQALDG